jgi:hypothetical protein
MGFADVHVLKDGLSDISLEKGPWKPQVLGLRDLTVPEIQPGTLRRMDSRSDFAVIDLSLSTNYRRAHIPGAWFGVRSQLADTLAAIGNTGEVIFTSGDGALARLAAADAAGMCRLPVHALAGGNEAWTAAGGEIESSAHRWAVPPRDVWLKPFDQQQGKVEDRLNAYLNWEVDLLQQVKRDGSVRFDFAALEIGRAAPRERAVAK